jgi:THO complex subunit 2
VPFSIRPEGAPKTNPSTKAEVEDGEIEDAKMTDVAMKGTEKAAKSKQEPSERLRRHLNQLEPSAAGPETAKEPIPSEKPAPEPAAAEPISTRSAFACTRCFSA